jgi:hypothetical protein
MISEYNIFFTDQQIVVHTESDHIMVITDHKCFT